MYVSLTTALCTQTYIGHVFLVHKRQQIYADAAHKNGTQGERTDVQWIPTSNAMR